MPTLAAVPSTAHGADSEVQRILDSSAWTSGERHRCNGAPGAESRMVIVTRVSRFVLAMFVCIAAVPVLTTPEPR
jgi:hypothetical protein